MTINSAEDQAGGAAGAAQTGTAKSKPRIDFDRVLGVLEGAGMIACTQTWSPIAQAHFLAMLSEGTTVAKAARAIGVTERSAYAFRRRNEGAIFDLGWRAANLLARDRLHDEMFRRSLHGQKTVVETLIETPDGERSIVSKRQSYDNRLGMAMLTRLDRLAAGEEPGTYVAHLVATDYDGFLARLASNAGGAELDKLVRRIARDLDEASRIDLAKTPTPRPVQPPRNRHQPS